ncbi:MAG: hypothetical protein ACI4RF_07810, partial [Eubacterium sp.]
SDDDELKLLAFTKEKTTVIIIINSTYKEKTVSFPANSANEAMLAVTDELHNLEEIKINNADIKISAKSVNTIIF